MKIDFNSLRKQTAFQLDEVIKILNSGIMPSNGYSSQGMPNGKMKQFEGNVLVSKERLQKHIDNLRSNVMFMCCLIDEHNNEFQEVYTEVEQSGGVARFNEEEWE